MPQEFQVLQCFQCSTFQVHQVKKAKKWSCKMCGEKQSVIKVFGRGVAADCRHHVQRLNSMRGEIDQVILETPTEPSTSQERLEMSQEQIGKDSIKNISSTDRWSRFVTSVQEAEDSVSEDQYDNRFTTDVEEWRQKQTTRKRKRNLRDDNHEDESSEQSQFIYHRSRGNSRGRPSMVDNSPELAEGPYMDKSRREDDLENNPSIQLLGDKSILQGSHHHTHAINSVKGYNRGQGHRSKLGGHENVADQHSCYDEDQLDVLLGCRSSVTARTDHGNYQGINEAQSLNTTECHHQVLNKGQSINRGRGHHEGMKKNKPVSKWSRYEDESDSFEETNTLAEQSEMINISENEGLIKDKNKPPGNVISVQSQVLRNRGTTGTILDSSVKGGKGVPDINTCSSSENLSSYDEIWRQSQHKMCTGPGGGYSKARRGAWESKLRGDNSNCLAALEGNQGNTDSQCEDNNLIKAEDLKSVKKYQTSSESVASCRMGILNSYVSEHNSKSGVELSSVSRVTMCKQRIGYSGHISSQMPQKPAPLQSMFVTEDITDEDLLL